MEQAAGGRGALAEELRRWRRRARLSQRDLARLSGLSQGTIRDIETGSQTRPKLDTLRLLARAIATGEDRVTDEDTAHLCYLRMFLAAGYDAAPPEILHLPEGVSPLLIHQRSLELESDQIARNARIQRITSEADRLFSLIALDELSDADADLVLSMLRTLAERFPRTPDEPAPPLPDDA